MIDQDPKTEDEDYQFVRNSDSKELNSHHFDLHGPLKQHTTAPHEREVGGRFGKEAQELPGLPGPAGPPGSRGKHIKLTS